MTDTLEIWAMKTKTLQEQDPNGLHIAEVLSHAIECSHTLCDVEQAAAGLLSGRVVVILIYVVIVTVRILDHVIFIELILTGTMRTVARGGLVAKIRRITRRAVLTESP